MLNGRTYVYEIQCSEFEFDGVFQYTQSIDIYDMLYGSSIGTDVEFDDVYNYMMCIGIHKDLQLQRLTTTVLMNGGTPTTF